MMICELIEKFVVFVSPDRTPLVPPTTRGALRPLLPAPWPRATHQLPPSVIGRLELPPGEGRFFDPPTISLRMDNAPSRLPITSQMISALHSDSKVSDDRPTRSMPTTRSKAPPKASKAPVKRDKENAKPSNAMNAKPSANVKPSKKGAGTKANTAAIPTISEMKAKLDEEASRGLDAYVQKMELNNNWVKASDPKLAEKEELADLAFMGIRGQTPGGSRWRTRVTTNKVSIAPMAVLTEECHI
jgi:hypothetical protein